MTRDLVFSVAFEDNRRTAHRGVTHVLSDSSRSRGAHLLRRAWTGRVRITPAAAAETMTVYLGLPVLIFLTAYLHAAISTVAVVVGVGLILLRRRWVRSLGGGLPAVFLPIRTIVGFGIVSLALAAYTGVLGGVRPTTDWYKHFAILADLTTASWPVSYPSIGNPTLVYSFAFYLPPALVGKMAGGSILVAHIALMLWMALGFALLVLLVATLLPRRFRGVGAVAAFVTYAGADAFGTWLMTNQQVSSVNGFWVGFASYTASFTAIRWVPQHAIASYAIGAVYVLAWRENSWPALRRFAVVSSLAALWTPFAVVGAVPLGLALLIRLLLRGHRPNRGEIGLVALGMLLALPAVAFVLLPRGGQHLTLTDLRPEHITLFLVLMLGPWVLCSLIGSRWRGALIAPVAFLIVLPIFVLGQNNDLVMRASLASLFALGLLAWDSFLRRAQRRRARVSATTRLTGGVLAVAVLFGLPTGAAEFNLAVTTREDGGAMVAGSPWDQNLASYLLSSGFGTTTAIWAQYMTCAHGRPVVVLGLPECQFDPQQLLPPMDSSRARADQDAVEAAKQARFFPPESPVQRDQNGRR